MVKSVNPYLNFPGNTEEAFGFYQSVFGGDFVQVVRFRDLGENAGNITESELDKIMHIALPIGGGVLLMGTDTLESFGQTLVVGNNAYIQLEAESGEEAEKVFQALSAGGKLEMPLEETEWAEKFGICSDKFGVQWMVNYEGKKQMN